jgi:hypothetical protein
MVMSSIRPSVFPPASWPRAGRVAAAVTLVLAAALPLVSHLIQPTFLVTEDFLDWAATEPGTAELTKFLDVLVLPLLFGTGLVYVLLSRHGAPRLAVTGGGLLGCGLVGLSVVEGHEALAVSLAADPRVDRASLVAAVDQTGSAAALLALALLVVGGVVGTITLAVALARSGAVPRWVAALVPLPILIDTVLNESLGVGPHWLAHAVALVVACLLAALVLTAGRAVDEVAAP